jgi:arginine/ornithine transport system substrate-binding protein
MNKFALFGALALSLFSLTATADEAKPIRIGIEAGYPPFSMKTSDGKLTGFDVDLGDALCEQMKVKCTWVEQEFDGLIPALKVKKIDAILSSTTITGSTVKDPLTELKGKKVGVLRASTHDRFATEVLAPAGINLVRYGSQQEANLDMLAGRVDALLADSVNLDDGFLKTDAGKGFAFVGPEYNDPKYFGGGAGIAVRKGDTALAEQFNKAITDIRANGKYKQVQDKYFDFDVYGE